LTPVDCSRVSLRSSRADPGTESFLTSLVDKCQYDFSYLTGTLQPLRMNPPLREAAAAALVPPSSPTGILSIAGGKTRVKDLLYVLLIADGHIVTLLRPRRHSIHPSGESLLCGADKTCICCSTLYPRPAPSARAKHSFLSAFPSLIRRDLSTPILATWRPMWGWCLSAPTRRRMKSCACGKSWSSRWVILVSD
jgi:hypothetical protein